MTEPKPRPFPPELQNPDPAIGQAPGAPRLAIPGKGKGHYNAHQGNTKPDDGYRDPRALDVSAWYDQDLQRRVEAFKKDQPAFIAWIDDTVLASMIRIGDYLRMPNSGMGRDMMKAAQEFLRLADDFHEGYKKNNASGQKG